MFRSTTAAIVAFMSLVVPAGAEDNPVVVELFTSQGCSSCPPADALMHELAGRDDVIALALHVDYWDYIGWKDLFADPAHTLRQKAYAREGGRTMIYTPQMIVNGQDDIAGADGLALMDLIDAHRSEAAEVSLRADRAGGQIGVEVRPLDLPHGDSYDVQVVQYSPLRHAEIKRGELAGRKLDYANVVESWQVLGQWNGAEAQTYSATLKSDLPAVILVQRAGQGPIIAAARAE
ncbi:DUF1223 domain-containing protein [Ruegeria sediminis]|uniref:DUF1223 domain-containing protein n=2 Tax=Ruegeria sediminis TaxID=2583820 RepID=A0ABY2WW96_9RHOB|nr:DUF1223 domain-containing protein [Ruegeria sediminis]